MNQNGARFKRWLDIAIMAIIAGAMAFLADALLREWTAAVQRFFADWPPAGIPILLVILLSPLWIALTHLRGLAPGHYGGWRMLAGRLAFPPVLQYPPTWLAVPIAAGAVWLLSHLIHPTRPALGYPLEVWAWAACVLLASMLWALLTSALLLDQETRKPELIGAVRPPTSNEALRTFRDDPITLIKWLSREAPIERPEQDLFGASLPATRLARRLFETPLQTYGLVGRRGIGKTSLLKLAELDLAAMCSAIEPPELTGPRAGHAPRYVWTCWIDAWGLQSGAGAAEYVLARAVEALSRHVDCVAVAGLPAHYRAALSEGHSSWIKMLGALFSRSPSPVDLLRRFDPILLAVNAQLVIFIQDLDRNPSEEGLFRQVEAMLDRLRQVERVTFVLAVSEVEGRERQFSGIDFTRLCDRTEVLPELDPWLTWQVLEAFRAYCLSHFADEPDGDIDPAPAESRAALGPLDQTRWAFGGGSEPWTFVPRQLAALIATPRVLKQAMRRTWQAWQSLHGEADFDDLLTCNVLRFASEPTYNFLLTQISRIRDVPVVGEGGKSEEEVKRAQESFAGMMAMGSRAGVLPQTLVFFLFPALSNRFVPRRPVVPQGVSIFEPTDYWVRINAEAIDSGLRDQEVLRAMRDGKSSGPTQGALVGKLLEDAAFAQKFEQFASRSLSQAVDFGADDIRRVATDLFAQILNRFGAAASAESVPGYLALWRSALQKHGGDHAKWLVAEARKALGRSARFAVELLYYWGDVNSGLLDVAGQTMVHGSMLDDARKLFDADPARLVSVLHTSDPATIFRLVSPPDASSSPEALPRWLGPTLLAATTVAPTLLIPQIGYLLSEPSRQMVRNSGHTVGEIQTNHRISDEKLASLYPDPQHRAEILAQLAKDHGISGVDAPTMRMVETLRDEARRRTEWSSSLAK